MLVLGKRGNGHWVYFNTQDNTDNGTIVDFMVKRGLSFADIRARFAPPQTTAPQAAASFRDIWKAAKPHPVPPWLIGRGYHSAHAANHTPDHAFLSTAGAPSRSQCNQIQHAINTLPNLNALVLAQDGDEAGDRQGEAIRKAVVLAAHVRLERRRPPHSMDWNDIVRA